MQMNEGKFTVVFYGEGLACNVYLSPHFPEMACASVHCKAVVLLILNHCLLSLKLFVGFFVRSKLCGAILCILCGLTFVSPGRRELITLLWL